MSLVLIFIFSIILSYFFLKISLPILRRKIIDKPNKRSSHSLPTPSGGGLSFVLVGTTFSIIMGNYIPLISLPLAIVGLIDDSSKIKRSFRYIAQLLTIIFMLIIFPEIFILFSLSSKILLIPSLLFVILFGTAVINFFNFMDGMDGLLAGNMIVIFTMGAFLVSRTYFPIVGALIGFIILNWHPAKVFMGDTGSTFLGAIFFGLILSTGDIEFFIKFILISSPILLDAFVCVIRRFLKKQNIFEPHKLHLYQRLNQNGWSHSSVSLLYISGTLLIASTILLGNIQITFFSLLFVFGLGFWLDKKKAIPFF